MELFSVNFTIKELPELFDKLSLNGTFMISGAITMIISTFNQYELGLKLGVLTLTFGAFYRVQLHINRAMPAHLKYHSVSRVFWINLFKFFLWTITLSLYLFFVDKVVFNLF